jgi:hypothetical protein
MTGLNTRSCHSVIGSSGAPRFAGKFFDVEKGQNPVSLFGYPAAIDSESPRMPQLSGRSCALGRAPARRARKSGRR